MISLRQMIVHQYYQMLTRLERCADIQCRYFAGY